MPGKIPAALRAIDAEIDFWIEGIDKNRKNISEELEQSDIEHRELRKRNETLLENNSQLISFNALLKERITVLEARVKELERSAKRK